MGRMLSLPDRPVGTTLQKYRDVRPERMGRLFGEMVRLHERVRVGNLRPAGVMRGATRNLDGERIERFLEVMDATLAHAAKVNGREKVVLRDLSRKDAETVLRFALMENSHWPPVPTRGA